MFWELAVSEEEEDISPQCDRKRFLIGLTDGLPECRKASASSLFKVSFIAGALVELI